MTFVTSASWIFIALGYILGSIVVYSAILYFVRKHVSQEQFRKNHDVSGFLFSLVGVLYSVILGFVVVNTHDHYNEADQIIHEEAMALTDLYRMAAFFPESDQQEMRIALKNYLNYVLEQEWLSNNSWHVDMKPEIQQLWDSYRNASIPDLKSAVCYSQALQMLDQLMDARLSRAFNSWGHLSATMWLILIGGAALTLIFTFFFSLENFRLQMFMTSLLAGFLTAMLLLVYSLDHAYKDPQAIQPTALYEVMNLFNQN